MPSVPVEQALSAVGELLQADGESEAIVLVGGATLNLLGLVRRATGDVDVIARAFLNEDGALQLEPPTPFPPGLQRAIATVARDFQLPGDWMNAAVGEQWVAGLPPRIADDITWRQYAGLSVGLVGRRTLVALKLYAAADSSPAEVHVQDLVAMNATDAELDAAVPWVLEQDGSEFFGRLVQGAITYVRSRRS